jgi:hypothetical protein
VSRLNHFAISAILQSEIVGPVNLGHGQIASLGGSQRYFDVLGTSESPSISGTDIISQMQKVIKAFLAIREERGDRGSADLYVADPNRNAQFLAKCRAMGIKGNEYLFNKALLHARKTHSLPRLDSVKTSIDYERQAFACEFAATQLKYRTGATIDEMLCDPTSAAEFENIARQITPGLSSFEYRWAILSIRKSGRRQKLPPSFKLPRFKDYFKLTMDPLNRIPEVSGVYLLFENKKMLYVHATDQLRRSVDVHRDPKVLGTIVEKLWQPKFEDFTVRFAIIKAKKSYLQAVEKKVVEKYRPVFNVPRSAA